MVAKKSPQPKKHDRVGQEIKLGSIVVAPDTRSSVFIGRVIKIMNVQIKVESLGSGTSSYRSSYNKYPNAVVCIDELEHTVMYLMARNL